MKKLYGAIVSLVLLSSMFVPLIDDRDGFPLSTYPMFSRPRPSEVTVYHVVGFSSQGRHRPISPDALGTDEVMQAHATIKLAVRRKVADRLCQDVAQRLAADADARDLELLEVRRETFDLRRYFRDARRPVRSETFARCALERKS